MSQFDTFNSAAFGAAAAIFGEVSFTLDSVTYTGVLNEFTAERELEIGGFVGNFAATLVCSLAQFSAITAPVERTLEGHQLTLSGRTFRIQKAAADECTLTLGLVHPK